jgi:hypothetical protein
MSRKKHKSGAGKRLETLFSNITMAEILEPEEK